ncbi:MAG: hypothetical protein S4CHLAM7_04880 [Chlamydiae bacterium]|nr:hypothetical protein [Chlamydiota bacterium]
MVEGTPIGGKGDIGPSKAIPQGDVSSQDTDQTFKQLVGQKGNSESAKPSPMNVAGQGQGGVQASKASPENLVANMQLVLGQMKNLGAALQTPGLKLNPRTRRLLDAKLKRSKDHIQYVSSKVNVGDEKEEGQKGTAPPVDDAVDATSGKKSDPAIEKFLGYLTDGQSQLQSAMQNVSKLKTDKNNPGMMLKHIFGMQVKLYRAQVEIEFSSAVLQKAIDDLKTIMSVQL